MKLTKRGLMALGAGLCASAVAWHLGVAPRWTQRIPPGWTWQARFVGTQTFTDPRTGKLPAKDATAVYERTMGIASDAGRPRSIRVEDRYVTRDPAGGQVTWEYRYAADVDPATGEHLAPEHRGQYFVFPRNLEKHTYVLRYSYVKGVPLAFEKEDDIDDLPTYLFSYHGRGEYTESFAGTEEYPGVPVKPGQEIRCADDQLVLRAWVEPVTGETIKIDESCDAGDYIYDIATGKRLDAVDRWNGTIAGDDVTLRVNAVRASRTRYLWATRWVPGLLGLGGVLLLALSVWRRAAADGARQLDAA